ncbi:DUF3558 family protein [Streptomyces minutiscleroticus]|uniref:DUF3558 domain-containing protein n=1 Tax=Streptomyces minutiscleroticus TaxID=68238 RepID=A0A918NNU2_9ACTN|nr:DUF3558 family protein [Streptomyces minutiscleroticus]GGX83580.1 hypothetical protein GCM10010358_42390 [Streptomyces minutiscleroticus]
MHRPAQRLTRILVSAAAVPALFAVSGCSSDSGSGDGEGGDAGAKASASASASATETAAAVKEATYAKLPEPCDVLSSKTLKDLVPEGAKAGKEGQSSDTSARVSCSWDSLDNNGVKGSQFRWLNVSLLRFESDAARGSGDELAGEYYTKQVKAAQAVDGAKNTESEPVTGTGDEATAVRYDLKKKEGSFKQQTVVARVENVVVTLDYNGAGLAGDKTPDADDLAKAAAKAAKEAVASVVSANGSGSAEDDGAGKSASPSASKSASSGKGSELSSDAKAAGADKE